MQLSERVNGMLNEAISVRRDLHKIPEIGLHEYKTSEYICSYLEKLNIKFEKNIVKTGIVAYIEGKSTDISQKKTLAFRADMDALSLTEMNDVEFKSTHEGCMHGCGHDGHMTMLLLFAKYLSENIEKVKDNIVLIFQPAEEGPGGAELMVKAGVLKDYKVDEIFGIHLHPEFDQGVIAINSGPVMAKTGEFDIDIVAKSGHGAMPHTAVDGIVLAANYINAIQSVISRNINPTEAGVITIGRMEAGERRNIIAENVRLEGTTRAFTEETFAIIKNRMYEIADGFEKAYHCKIDIEYREMYPPVINHIESVEMFLEANKTLNVVKFPPQMIAEDFSYFLKEVPGAFYFVGTKNLERNYVFPLHNSKFNFDESALLYGVQSYINVLEHRGNL